MGLFLIMFLFSQYQPNIIPVLHIGVGELKLLKPFSELAEGRFEPRDPRLTRPYVVKHKHFMCAVVPLL